MHDPMTVICTIKSPFYKRKPSAMNPRGYRETIATLWHVDPEKDGTDDSCDWFNRKRPLNTQEQALQKAIFAIENTLDNPPHYPSSPEHEWYQTLKDACRAWRRSERRWWQHPRWHIWHWRLQIDLWNAFHRWVFGRCVKCGGRFKWEEGVIGSWDGKAVWHFDCDRIDAPPDGRISSVIQTMNAT